MVMKVLTKIRQSSPPARTSQWSALGLKVSLPGDTLEREADRVADEVLRQPGPAARTLPAGSGDDGSHRIWGAGAGNAMRACGAPNGGVSMDAATRTFMEPRFGWDFGHIRIHADTGAARAARAANARAFTVGNDIAFAEGQYSPGTHEGRKLIAHELAHTLQQRSSAPLAGSRPRPGVRTASGRLQIARQAPAGGDIESSWIGPVPGSPGNAFAGEKPEARRSRLAVIAAASPRVQWIVDVVSVEGLLWPFERKTMRGVTVRKYQKVTGRAPSDFHIMVANEGFTEPASEFMETVGEETLPERNARLRKLATDLLDMRDALTHAPVPDAWQGEPFGRMRVHARQSGVQDLLNFYAHYAHGIGRDRKTILTNIRYLIEMSDLKKSKAAATTKTGRYIVVPDPVTSPTEYWEVSDPHKDLPDDPWKRSPRFEVEKDETGLFYRRRKQDGGGKQYLPIQDPDLVQQTISPPEFDWGAQERRARDKSRNVR